MTGHGPEFHKHMYRINAATRCAKIISVYHTFHDEVALYTSGTGGDAADLAQVDPRLRLREKGNEQSPGLATDGGLSNQNSCGGTYTKESESRRIRQKEGKRKQKGCEQNVAGQKDISDNVWFRRNHPLTPSLNPEWRL